MYPSILCVTPSTLCGTPSTLSVYLARALLALLFRVPFSTNVGPMSLMSTLAFGGFCQRNTKTAGYLYIRRSDPHGCLHLCFHNTCIGGLERPECTDRAGDGLDQRQGSVQHTHLIYLLPCCRAHPRLGHGTPWPQSWVQPRIKCSFYLRGWGI